MELLNNSILATLLRDNPIVVTGMGSFGAAGRDVSQLWQAALAGRPTASWCDFEMGGEHQKFAACRAGEITGVAPAVRKMDRSVQMAWVAAREAWTQAGGVAAYDPARVGIMVGSSRGPLGKRNESLAQPMGKYPPSLAINSTFASMSGVLAQTFKVRGPGAAVSATCASSAFAIGMAAEQICLGKADAMVVGGTEAILNLAAIGQLHSLGVLGFHEDAPQTCRPFDSTRNGLVLGEGSGFLVLESARGAAARGATILGRLAGWAYRLNDSGRVGVHEDGSSLLHVMAEALQLANIAPAEIGYINAHGTGTHLNDLAEAHSVRNLLGERATTVPCRSTKPLTGHCLGATPAIEAILCLEALRHQEIPPVMNCGQPDPQCPIHPQSPTGPTLPLNHVLSTSLGFWGYHAALVFSRA